MKGYTEVNFPSFPPSSAVPTPNPVVLQCQQHLQHTQQLLQCNTHDLSLFPPNPTHHPLEEGAGISPAPHGHECGPPPAQHLHSHRECAGVSSGTDSILCATHLYVLWPFAYGTTCALPSLFDFYLTS